MAEDWSTHEVDAIVADYFDMLRTELTGQPLNKRAHRLSLLQHLDGRSEGSIERKHQNISAALIEMGMPYINGYKPLSNYQRLVLPAAIDTHLRRHPELVRLFEDHSASIPDLSAVDDFESALVKPPEADPYPPNLIAGLAPGRLSGQINYLANEARNAQVGDLGEQFVLAFERFRLIELGKEQLADRIEQVSVTQGPSAGFDIRSFDDHGKDRFIEVKATKYGKHTPFFVTPHELAFSEEHASRYSLYRVFQLGAKSRLFILPGMVGASCRLAPSEYIARPR